MNLQIVFLGCLNRFTHANRRCSAHPRAGVHRDPNIPSHRSVLKVNQNISNTYDSDKSITKTPCLHIKRIGKLNSEKLKAVRKLKKELDAEAEDKEDRESFICASTNEHNETNEKIMGALALMELAGVKPIKIDYNSWQENNLY